MMTDPHSQSSRSGAIDNPPAPAPRPITARAARAAWFDARARLWWMLAIIVLIAVAVLGWEQYNNAAQANWLFAHGEKVDARVVQVNELVKRPNFMRQVDDPWPIIIEYRTADGVKHNVSLMPRDLTYVIHPEQKIPIRVDPARPEDRITFRLTKPPGFGIELLIPIAFFCVAMLFVAVAWWMRRGVLTLWRQGVAVPAQVLEIRRAAMAPNCHHVRCVIGQHGNGPVVGIMIPRKIANVQIGDVLWLIHDPNKPSRAIPAMNFAAE